MNVQTNVSVPELEPRAPASSRDFARIAGDLLPLADCAGVLLVGALTLSAHATLVDPGLLLPESWWPLHRLALVGACVAPFVLYADGFAEDAAAGRAGPLGGAFLRRLLLFLGLMGAIAFAGRWLQFAPRGWLVTWTLAVTLVTSASRMALIHLLRPVPRHPDEKREVPSPTARLGGGLPLIVLADRPIKRWNAVIKSGEDFVLGWIATVLLLPLLACIAIAIRLDSPGPIVFRQRRDGFNNRDFHIYKFRTMQHAVERPGDPLVLTARDDPRVTRVGRVLRKFSLDELPQLFNVLQGDMSLVGPRPHAVNMRTEDLYGHEITEFYRHRHRVKPGITGWSQVNGCRGTTSTKAQLQERVRLDLYYVDNWSVLLDLKILFLTVRAVARGTNAF